MNFYEEQFRTPHGSPDRDSLGSFSDEEDSFLDDSPLIMSRSQIDGIVNNPFAYDGYGETKTPTPEPRYPRRERRQARHTKYSPGGTTLIPGDEGAPGRGM